MDIKNAPTVPCNPSVIILLRSTVAITSTGAKLAIGDIKITIAASLEPNPPGRKDITPTNVAIGTAIKAIRGDIFRPSVMKKSWRRIPSEIHIKRVYALAISKPFISAYLTKDLRINKEKFIISFPIFSISFIKRNREIIFVIKSLILVSDANKKITAESTTR